MAAGASSPSIWRSRVLLIGGGTLLALVLLEAAVRILDLGPTRHEVSTELFRLSDDPELRYELRPGVQRGPVRINDRGMRDQPVVEDRPQRRIALVGDSIAFGYGADQGFTAHAWMERILEEHLAPDGPPFDVMGFGVTGYNILQSVRMLERRAENFDFDAVLFFYCMNDAQDYSFELEQLRAQLTPAERDFLGLTLTGSRSWLDRSRLWSLLRLALASRGEEGSRRDGVRPEPDWASLQRPRWADYFIDIHREGPGWERVEEGLARLGRFQTERDVPVYVILFPLFRDLERHPLRPLHQRVAAAAAAEGLRWLDLAGLFRYLHDQRPGLGVFDELHPDRVGYAFASLAILHVLANEGVLGPEVRDLRPVTEAAPPLGDWAERVRSMMSLPPVPPPGG